MSPRSLPDAAAGLLVWLLGWLALLLLDGPLDLANLALLLVLTGALAALWWPAWAASLGCAISVMAFNACFVPPRGSLAVDTRQHALLLASMLAVGLLVVGLVQRLRREAAQGHQAAAQEARLRAWGDALRDAEDPVLLAGRLAELLGDLSGGPVALMLGPDGPEGAGLHQLGEPGADARAGLAHCWRQGMSLGPGSGRHEEQPDLYLPLRGRGRTLGAAVLPDARGRSRADALLPAAQALCDLYGLALQRALVLAEARHAHEEAQLQRVRNALLASISHDHRTPLAAIVGAASSLQDQDARLAPEQRRRLVDRIVQEAARLRRLTDNTLQLARLDGASLAVSCDWQSAEELVGAALNRVRPRDPQRRVRARLEPGLPLLWCDATLLSQGLDNLIDNALAYSPPDTPVELLARATPEHVVLAVRDRGPGIAPAWRERVFQPFMRGAEPMAGHAPPAERPGSGVGLALCRAIAGALGGELRLRARGHGGSAFEFWLPRKTPPPVPAEPATDTLAGPAADSAP